MTIDSSLATHNKSSYHGTRHFMSHEGDMTFKFKFYSDLAISTKEWEKGMARNFAAHPLASGELGSHSTCKVLIFSFITWKDNTSLVNVFIYEVASLNGLTQSLL